MFDEHSQSKHMISLTLFVFQFEISGNDFNDEHSLNKQRILITLIVFHLEISGNNFNDEHPSNILLILTVWAFCENNPVYQLMVYFH